MLSDMDCASAQAPATPELRCGVAGCINAVIPKDGYWVTQYIGYPRIDRFLGGPPQETILGSPDSFVAWRPNIPSELWDPFFRRRFAPQLIQLLGPITNPILGSLLGGAPKKFFLGGPPKKPITMLD